MLVLPTLEEFSEEYAQNKNQIIYSRLAADLDTPVSLLLKLTQAATNSFVLESVTGGEVRGRYSIIGMAPDLIWRCKNGKSYLNRQIKKNQNSFEVTQEKPLDSLRNLLHESRIEIPDELPSSCAGLFGYLGYEMIKLVEEIPDDLPDPLNVPDSILMRPSVIVVLDGVKGEVVVVSPGWHSNTSTAVSYTHLTLPTKA